MPKYTLTGIGGYIGGPFFGPTFVNRHRYMTRKRLGEVGIDYDLGEPPGLYYFNFCRFPPICETPICHFRYLTRKRLVRETKISETNLRLPADI